MTKLPMAWWDNLEAPLLGRYRIERLLGEGGMAWVFLATDVLANRAVAFKTPKLEEFPPAAVKELLSRFNREFRSQASDPVQGVIPIYESGEFTDREGVVRPFLAMQYLSGGSLADLLGGTIGERAHRQILAEVLDWLVPIARTVDRLHARKYLHRDIKPDNILFNGDGDPFLADLGIVGSLDNTLGGSTMASTALGVLGSPGSPGYQSPESIQADAALRNVSASDQFSLAVTVYEALAGCLPVDASTNQQWYGALMHWSPTPLATHCPDMPQEASDAVMKAMSTQASGRFTSCSEFAKAMALSAQVRSAPPPPRAAPAASVDSPGSSVPLQPMSRRTKGLIAVAVFALLVLALGWSLDQKGLDANDVTGDHSGERPEPRVPVRAPAIATSPPWTVHFDADRSSIDARGRNVLDAAVAFLRRTPDARLLVVGHADQTEGAAAVAMRSSERRAESVREYLMLNGIDGARLRTEARGGSLPLRGSVQADDSTDQAAVAANRRVELRLDTAPAPVAEVAAPAAPSETENLPEPPRAEARPSSEDLKMCPAPLQEAGVEISIEACSNIIKLPGVSAANKAFALLHRGRNLVFSEDYAAADKDFSLAITLAPTDALRASAFDSRGKARIKAGNSVAGESDLAKARSFGAVTTIGPISTGKPLVFRDWKACFAIGVSADGSELLYTMSEVMDMRPVPKFMEILEAEQPYRPILQAAGAQPATIGFGCSAMGSEARDARQDIDAMVAKYLAENRGKFSKLRKLEATWIVPGVTLE